MIEPIVIKVTDKVPELVSGPPYVVCDNSDYTVVWQLDEEWAQFEHRTMQVNYKDGTYERVLFTGNSCTLPAIPVSGPVHVGLFAGDIHTTRPARLLAVRSATTDSGEERDPTPDGYAQAIKVLDGKLDKDQGKENAGKALVVGDDGNVVPGETQFFVNIASSMASGYTADKTYSEILAAIRSGKTVVARFLDSGLLLLLSSDKYAVQFRGLDPWSNKIVTAVVQKDNSIVYTRTPITDENAVHVTEQTLTADQQAQARKNIGFTPVAKTDAMTQSVGLDAETGELYTAPAAGDNTLGITGAQVGQIAKITAVDTDGKPTAWEAVDMPTGGGETWEKIAEIELRADTAEYVLADFATWRKAKVIMTRPQYISGLNKNVWCKVVGSDSEDTYSCGYLTIGYGYTFWEFSAEVNELFITTEALENNNVQIASYVKSSGTFTPIKSPVGIYKFELIFADTSVIQAGDKVTVIGVRR